MRNYTVLKTILSKLFEACIAVLPITFIIVVASLASHAMQPLNIVSVVIGALFLILGMVFYTIGSDVAIEPIGGHIGAKVAGTGKVWAAVLVCFLVGIIVTVAEPDLSVLASQIASVPKIVLIGAIGLGVGVSMMLGVLRFALKIDLKYIFLVLYAIVFIFAACVEAFVGDDYIPLAFDSGGVTTGPITVPFILTLCVGVSAVAGGSKSDENSFGMVGICSVGPIVAVLVLGLMYRSSAAASIAVVSQYASIGDVFMAYLTALPIYLKEVGIALAPIVLFFLFFQICFIKLPAKRLTRICVGAVYTYVGLSIFLTGANIGLIQAGISLGEALAGISKWIVLPIGAVAGACIVLAEPAVHVLNKQVEKITGGVIKQKTMMLVLSCSMALAVTVALLRAVTGISIWWFIAPGYGVALLLTFVTPKIFTAIAFDSGGVASGPMTATFLMPLSMGASIAVGGSILSDALGTVAMVAMTPLIALQVVGVVFEIKKKQATRIASVEYAKMLAEEGNIIELMEA